MVFILIDRLGQSPPGFKPIMPLDIGDHAALVRIAREERIQHGTELPAHLGQCPGGIDHRNVVTLEQ